MGHKLMFRDEVLYDAKIHPEQYSNTLTAAQVAQLHKSMRYVCQYAVDHLSDSSTFPEEWLFKHRWGKGKKDSVNTLPNGERFVYLTVGGRTSCVVPSVQRKTGPVAGDVDKTAKKRKAQSDDEESPKERKKTGPRQRKSEARRSREVVGRRKSAKENGELAVPGKRRVSARLQANASESMESKPKGRRKSTK